MFTKSLDKFNRAAAELAYRVELVKHSGNLPPLSDQDMTIVDALRQQGTCVTSLDALFSSNTPRLLKAAESLVPELPTSSYKKDRKYALASPNQIMNHPDIFLWGLEERLLNIVENYIGVPVAYHGVSVRRDMLDGEQVGTRQWHIDIEDRRMVKIIVYFNDVNDEGGPYQYIPKHLTPRIRAFKQGYGFIEDKLIKNVVPESDWIPCTGSAGTVIFTDTCSIYHRGKVPVESERVAMFFSYTSRRPKNPSYCKSGFSHEQLLELGKTLSQHQKECVFWD